MRGAGNGPTRRSRLQRAAPRAEQVPSSSDVSLSRGAAVPEFLLPHPLPLISSTRTPPQFFFRAGLCECRSGPGEQAARRLRVSRFPPFSASAASVWRERDVSSRAESASPAGGARAPCSWAGGEVHTGAWLPTLRGAPGSGGTRTFREYVPLIPKTPAPRSLCTRQRMHGKPQSETVLGTKQCVGSQAYRSPRGAGWASWSAPQGPGGPARRQRPYSPHSPAHFGTGRSLLPSLRFADCGSDAGLLRA